METHSWCGNLQLERRVACCLLLLAWASEPQLLTPASSSQLPSSLLGQSRALYHFSSINKAGIIFLH